MSCLIAKPSAPGLDKFKSKRGTAMASVQTLQAALPLLKIKEAKDFVRLHPDEDDYWSPEFCFVKVPMKGQKKDTLHLIDEDLAASYLVEGKVERFRLALATKPFDISFCVRCPRRTWTTTGTPATSGHVSRPRGCGYKPQVKKVRASTATRSAPLETAAPSRSRNGQHRH